MEPIRILIFRQVLTLLFMSVTLDVPLPPPFSGKTGMKVKVPSEWIDFILGDGGWVKSDSEDEVSLLSASIIGRYTDPESRHAQE